MMSSVHQTPFEASPHGFGDYLVFVDESGDHSLTSIDPLYSVFVLAFDIIQTKLHRNRDGKTEGVGLWRIH